MALSLHRAAKEGNIAEMERLVTQKKTQIDKRDPYGSTPLLWAVQGGNKESINWLVEHGADLFAKGGYEGSSVLHCCVTGCKDLDILELLLGLGADPYLQDNQLKTPYERAEELKLEAIAKRLKLFHFDSRGNAVNPLIIEAKNRGAKQYNKEFFPPEKIAAMGPTIMENGIRKQYLPTAKSVMVIRCVESLIHSAIADNIHVQLQAEADEQEIMTFQATGAAALPHNRIHSDRGRNARSGSGSSANGFGGNNVAGSSSRPPLVKATRVSSSTTSNTSNAGELRTTPLSQSSTTTCPTCKDLEERTRALDEREKILNQREFDLNAKTEALRLRALKLKELVTANTG